MTKTFALFFYDTLPEGEELGTEHDVCAVPSLGAMVKFDDHQLWKVFGVVWHIGVEEDSDVMVVDVLCQKLN